MIIKSHVRGGYRSATAYLKSQGQNEKIRTVEISDIDAKDLDEAFRNMWVVASNTKVKKALHHISVNPFEDERLSDDQVQKIVERCEQKYGYKSGDHQRVIVEHIKDGRQHFHVIWNRVSLKTNKAQWPGEHWKKSKQVCREMEKELGLKTPVPRRTKRLLAHASGFRRARGTGNRYASLKGKAVPNFSGISKGPASDEKEPTRPAAFMVPTSTQGWPEAAILAWKTWGHMDPTKFFRIWAELAVPGRTPA